MNPKVGILSEYVTAAMAHAEYERFEEDGSYGGHVAGCPGVVAFGATREDCEGSLRSVVEDWILFKLKRGVPVPVIDGINLNRDIVYVGLESV